MCAAELTWYTLKVYNWILMKHTWWNGHAVPGTAHWNMGHTAGTLRKIGIYFILRNNWHINVPWNISKIFYWISFFSVQHMVSILNCMIFCIVYYANWTYCDWCTWLVAPGNPTLCVGSHNQPYKNLSAGATKCKNEIKFICITFQFCISTLSCCFDLLPVELHQEARALTINSDNLLQNAACFEDPGRPKVKCIRKR